MTQRKRTYRREKAGYTLAESAIVLGVIGVMLGAIWVAYGHVSASNQIRTSTMQLITIANNVRAVFAEQGGVAGSSTSALNQALDQLKVFPLDMRQGTNPTGVVFNIWSHSVLPNGGAFNVGTVQVYADDCTGNEGIAGTQPCFGITFFNVPKDACISMISQAGQGGMGLQQVIVNGGGGTAPPVSPVQARQLCSNATANNVLWVYLLKQ